MKKVFKILAIMLIITSIATITVYGFTVNELTGDISKIDQTGTDIIDVGNTAIYFVSMIGSGISVITLIILGIKYMLGSVEEKASYKRTLLPYIIGALLVFGASIIAGIINQFFK